MNEREKTIQDMKENLVRMKVLESHAKMFCNETTQLFVEVSRLDLEQAIKAEESKDVQGNSET